MIPSDDSNDIYLFKQTANYSIYQSQFYKYEGSNCDKPLLAHDVYMRWIHEHAKFADLTKKQIQLAAYTGYSLMYKTAAENQIWTVVQ